MYIAVWRSAFVAIDAVQRRKLINIVWLVAGCVLAAGVSAAAVAIESLEPRPNYAVRVSIAVFSLTLIGVMWLAGFLDKQLTWQDKKRRKELSKQIKLHLALVTGALIFSVPFYWLVTTSLKPDVRTNVFPPDLIPVQQTSVKIDGEDRDVYVGMKIRVLNHPVKEIKVAKMAELEDDMWQVRPLPTRNDTPLERDLQAHPPEADWVVKKTALKPDLHRVLLWKNYSDALAFLPPEYKHGLKPLWNTVYITLLVILGTVLSSSLVAFSFARLRWPGRNVLFVVLLATMMIPSAVTMLPVFLIFRALGWIDTLRPLWFPALFGSAFNVFLLRQFFMTIPNELEDAAKIDGCSYFTIYWKIMLPLIKPALAAITIFAFMGSWNNFMGPLIYLSSPENMTLAYALQLFQGMHGGEPSMMMAASTLVMLPVLGVFFFTQRYMIQGVTLTGIKG